MSSYAQNLFLFFQESEDKSDVSSNIVRLAMNKFIVDEDAQFEIIGVYCLNSCAFISVDMRIFLVN